MTDLGIKAVASYIPETRIQNASRLAEFGVDQTWLEDKLGFLKVARKAASEETSDLAVKAVQKLLDSDLDLAAVDCLVVVTQNPDGFGLPHTAGAVHAKLGLGKGCAGFDLSLGCSGYVYGLSVILSLMRTNGLRCGLLVTADPYSRIVRPEDRDTAMIFGDGAAATLIGPDPVWRVGACDFVTDGAGRAALEVDATRALHMNGRAVFNFCATTVPDSIRRACALNAVKVETVDRFLLHQGSRFIVDTVGKRLGCADRCGFHAAEYGNTVSSSLPILLERDVAAEDRVLALSGFGVGLSCASTVLKRV